MLLWIHIPLMGMTVLSEKMVGHVLNFYKLKDVTSGLYVYSVYAFMCPFIYLALRVYLSFPCEKEEKRN